MNRSWNKVIWYLEDVLAQTGVADSEKELMTRTRNIISKTIFTLVRWYFNDWIEPISLPLVGTRVCDDYHCSYWCIPDIS